MKKTLIGLTCIAILLVLAVHVSGIAGQFSKAFTKTVYPNDAIQQNVTIRKFYNVTVKFQKLNSTSDITIRNSNTTIILEDVNGLELYRSAGMDGTYVSAVLEKLQLDKVKFLSAYNLNNSLNIYEDIVHQSVNITYSGTKATIVGKTNQISSGSASVTGYILDELTSQQLDGIDIFVFNLNSNPVNSNPIAQNTTDIDGRYFLSLTTNSLGKSFDFYVKDYNVSSVS